jgi:hypothetical protein
VWTTAIESTSLLLDTKTWQHAPLDVLTHYWQSPKRKLDWQLTFGVGSEAGMVLRCPGTMSATQAGPVAIFSVATPWRVGPGEEQGVALRVHFPGDTIRTVDGKIFTKTVFFIISEKDYLQ